MQSPVTFSTPAHDPSCALEPVPGTVVLQRLARRDARALPAPHRTIPDAPPPADARSVTAIRRLAARRIHLALAVAFGLRSTRVIAGREFAPQVRTQAAALRLRASSRRITNLRIVSLHLRPAVAAREARSYEVFGSVLAGDRPHAFSARLDGERLALLRVA